MSVGRQITFGFAAVISATLVTGAVAAGALYATVTEKDQLARDYAEDLARVENLRYRAEQVVATSRGYLLTGDGRGPTHLAAANDAFLATWRAVKTESISERQDLERVQRAWNEYLDVTQRAAVRRANTDEVEDVVPYFERVVQPARHTLESRLDDLVEDERHDWNLAFERSRDSARRAGLVVLLITAFGIGASIWLARLSRRRLQEHLSAQLQALRARDEVLSVVSHDLKNPLTAILLVSQLARAKAEPHSLKRFDKIHDAAQRMDRLIDELVETARVESGALTLACQRLDVPPLITRTLELFEEQAAQKTVKLVSLLPAHALAFADPNRLGRVLTNLFGNALKFTPPGGRITVRAEPSAGFLDVSVSDTGPGVPAEQLPHLFEKHWQARREKGDGLGLGLFIVKGLVEAHGGSIAVTSTPGAGATFSFRIPAAPAPASG